MPPRKGKSEAPWSPPPRDEEEEPREEPAGLVGAPWRGVVVPNSVLQCSSWSSGDPCAAVCAARRLLANSASSVRRPRVTERNTGRGTSAATAAAAGADDAGADAAGALAPGTGFLPSGAAAGALSAVGLGRGMM